MELLNNLGSKDRDSSEDKAVREALANKEVKVAGVSKGAKVVKVDGEVRVDKVVRVVGASREVKEDGNDVNPLNINHQNIDKYKSIKIHSTYLLILFQSIPQQSIRYITDWNLPLQNDIISNVPNSCGKALKTSYISNKIASEKYNSNLVMSLQIKLVSASTKISNDFCS